MLSVKGDGRHRKQAILSPEEFHRIRRNLALNESCKKWRELREGKLDLGRSLQDSDHEMDTTDSSEMDSQSSEQLSESGDLGGVVCPVCCRFWYTIQTEIARAICEGCQLPVSIPPKMSSRELRWCVKQVLRQHSENCSECPEMTHLPEGDVYSLICICAACDFLEMLF